MQQLKISTLLQGGKYRIEKVLGQGGFGITYLATQVVLNRKVAIKEFFMKEYCNRDAETSHVTIPSDGSKEFVARFRQKFIKEAQTIAGLNHPHIIRIHDIFEENDTAYYVMEYHDNGSLSELVKQHGALPEAEALRYIREVADALAYIHEHQMNHLDVKPGNVLLDEKGRSVLIDFGLSKRYDESGQQTSTTPVGISHGYAPMEQYKQGGVGTFSPATDIYSLGATLYKLLTGKTPPDASDVFTDGLPALPSSISVAVSNAIAQAMLPNKKKRPQSVAAFLALLDKEPVVTPNEDDDEEDTVLEIDPQPAPTPKPQPKPQPQPAPAPAPQPTPTSSKNKWLVPTLIAVVVALAIIFWPRGGGEEPVLPIADTPTVASVVVEDSMPLAPVKEVAPVVPSLSVITSPAGATVKVDGKAIGKTPIKDKELDGGKHTVQISLDGYETITKTVQMSESKELNLKMRQMASLSVTTSPAGAIVYLDGKNFGTTPIKSKSLSIGEHSIKIVKDGYADLEFKRQFSGGNVSENHSLKELPQTNVAQQTTTTQVNEAKQEVKPEEDDQIYTVAEVMPEFPDGGTSGLMKYINDNLKYPPIAQENGIQGRVIVSFVVNKDGSISNARVVRGVDASLDREALRLVNSMPKWIPGKKDGKVVRVSCTHPISFRIR